MLGHIADLHGAFIQTVLAASSPTSGDAPPTTSSSSDFATPAAHPAQLNLSEGDRRGAQSRTVRHGSERGRAAGPAASGEKEGRAAVPSSLPLHETETAGVRAGWSSASLTLAPVRSHTNPHGGGAWASRLWRDTWARRLNSQLSRTTLSCHMRHSEVAQIPLTSRPHHHASQYCMAPSTFLNFVEKP
jgi:hypothetical protein